MPDRRASPGAAFREDSRHLHQHHAPLTLVGLRYQVLDLRAVAGRKEEVPIDALGLEFYGKVEKDEVEEGEHPP